MAIKQTKSKFISFPRRQLFYLAVVILLGIILIPRFNQLPDSIDAIRQASFGWILIAVIGLVGSYFATAFTLKALASRLRILKTTNVQLATSFANRVLPSGLGWIGVNADYILKSGYKAVDATAVMVVSSLSAFVSHVLLIFLAISFGHRSISTLWDGRTFPMWIVVVSASIILIVLIGLKLWHRKIIKALRNTFKRIISYKRRPWAILAAIFSSTLVTASYVFTLWACAKAVGMDIGVIEVFVIYTLGVVAGKVTLTPGGLGGTEAGLAAGLIAYHHPESLAFSAVIIFRLITFWLPILPGYLSFWLLRRRKII